MRCGSWAVLLSAIVLVAAAMAPGCSSEDSSPATSSTPAGTGGQGGSGAQGGTGQPGGSGGVAGSGGAGGALETGCCTVAGIDCCTSVPPTDDWCHDADDCLVTRCRNGSEVCDDERATVDPALNQYFLLCQTAGNGVGYAATNSGGPCDGTNIARCRCWEEAGERPWEELNKLGELVCDQVGNRVEVIFPSAGPYYIGVHATPGEYTLADHCPQGDGCMTSIALIEIPR